MTTPHAPSVPAAGWARRYPPLAGIGFVLLAVLLVLPSALRAPHANPTTTPEFAPVPPEDAEPNDQQGNTSSLGLGSSGIGGEIGGSPEEPLFDAPPPPGEKVPTTMRCYGNPPRQTEDPTSPPCVSTFKGENGGATYQGVTANEVRILFYIEGTLCDNSVALCRTPPARTYNDLGKPATGQEDYYSETLRTFQTYFNERYQTYNRFVRFIIYFADRDASDTSQRLADAAENFKAVTPFAVFTYMPYGGNSEPYLDAMAKRGVFNFGAFAARKASFFQRYARLIWGYFPSAEQQAMQFASFLCEKAVKHNTSFSSNTGQNGTPRRFGILTSDDPIYPGYKALSDDVKRRLQACGGNVVAEELTPGTGERTTHDRGEEIAGNFQQAGVTTVLWFVGYDVYVTNAFGLANYRPEIIAAGDRRIEGGQAGGAQDRLVWANAFVVSNTTPVGDYRQSHCVQAFRQYNTTTTDSAAEIAACRPFYVDLRQLFTAVQVAGPRLGPATVDRGLHAIPPVESTDPQVPACYYDRDDYTCVKDAMVVWWDTQRSCYRMALGARRHIAGRWPPGDVLSLRNDADECNRYFINQ